jgi:hypothetical protein
VRIACERPFIGSHPPPADLGKCTDRSRKVQMLSLRLPHSLSRGDLSRLSRCCPPSRWLLENVLIAATCTWSPTEKYTRTVRVTLTCSGPTHRSAQHGYAIPYGNGMTQRLRVDGYAIWYNGTNPASRCGVADERGHGHPVRHYFRGIDTANQREHDHHAAIGQANRERGGDVRAVGRPVWGC